MRARTGRGAEQRTRRIGRARFEGAGDIGRERAVGEVGRKGREQPLGFAREAEAQVQPDQARERLGVGRVELIEERRLRGRALGGEVATRVRPTRHVETAIGQAAGRRDRGSRPVAVENGGRFDLAVSLGRSGWRESRHVGKIYHALLRRAGQLAQERGFRRRDGLGLARAPRRLRRCTGWRRGDGGTGRERDVEREELAVEPRGAHRAIATEREQHAGARGARTRADRRDPTLRKPVERARRVECERAAGKEQFRRPALDSQREGRAGGNRKHEAGEVGMLAAEDRRGLRAQGEPRQEQPRGERGGASGAHQAACFAARSAPSSSL